MAHERTINRLERELSTLVHCYEGTERVNAAHLADAAKYDCLEVSEKELKLMGAAYFKDVAARLRKEVEYYQSKVQPERLETIKELQATLELLKANR